jgi:hypothetical protein
VLAAAAAQKHAIPTDPQVLVNPATQQQILAGFKAFLGPQTGTVLFDQFISTVSGSLLDGVRASFFAMLVMALAALVATLFLKEIPLRTTNAEPAAGEAPVVQEPATPLMLE